MTVPAVSARTVRLASRPVRITLGTVVAMALWGSALGSSEEPDGHLFAAHLRGDPMPPDGVRSVTITVDPKRPTGGMSAHGIKR
jgi:hypothetical protein